MMLPTLRITIGFSYVRHVRLARPFTWWPLLFLLRLVLEILLVVGHDLNNFIAKVICVVYLVGSEQFAPRIPRHMFRIFAIRLRIILNYRAIMVLQLGLIRVMIFVVLVPISTQVIVLEVADTHVFLW